MTQRGGKGLDCGNPPRLCFVSAEEALSFATEVRQRASLKQLGLPWSWKWRKWAVHKLYIYKYVCIYVYIYLHIYAFIYTFIRLFIFYSFVSFFVFFDFGSFISLNVHTKRGNRNVARAPICIYTYLPIIYIYMASMLGRYVYTYSIYIGFYICTCGFSLSLYICIYIYI